MATNHSIDSDTEPEAGMTTFRTTTVILVIAVTITSSPTDPCATKYCY
jgi:hypothetical protein